MSKISGFLLTRTAQTTSLSVGHKTWSMDSLKCPETSIAKAFGSYNCHIDGLKYGISLKEQILVQTPTVHMYISSPYYGSKLLCKS